MEEFYAGFTFVVPEPGTASVFSDYEYEPIDLINQPLQALSLENGILDEAVASLDKEIPLHLSLLSPSLAASEIATNASVSDSLDGLSDISNITLEDLWSSALTRSAAKGQDWIHSWDGFFDNKPESGIVYLSDGKNQMFDAALSWSGQERDRVLKKEYLIRSLIQLGLGRDSMLYTYDRQRKTFDALLVDVYMSGYSKEAVYSIVAQLVDLGCAMRRLRTGTSPGAERDKSSPASMAVLCEIYEALAVIEESVHRSADSVVSLLQLESLFEAHRQVLDIFSNLISSIDTASSDTDVISRIFNTFNSADHRNPKIQAVLKRILDAATRPWMNTVSAWLQILPDGDLNLLEMPSFVGRSSDGNCVAGGQSALLDCEFLPEGLTSLLTLDEGRLVFETGYLLRLMTSYCPNHPVLASSVSHARKLRDFGWSVSWCEIERSVVQAKRYELEMASQINQFENHTRVLSASRLRASESKHLHCPHADSMPKDERKIQHSLNSIEEPMSKDEVYWIDLLKLTTDDTGILPTSIMDIGPALSMALSLSIEPWISAQHRLANRACLWLLFKNHDLRSHLTLLYRFQLVGDGPFISRLCHALFSPDMPSAERNSREHRTGLSGLRLGHRATWPPASSELRLALTGILRDSYFTKGQALATTFYNQDLPGNLSFAIREMSEVDIKKCLDPHSVFALDFLCLEYRAPAPLDVVITPAILSKYDAMFRLLLRAKRMQYVVDRLTSRVSSSAKSPRFGTSLKLQHMSRHFVSSINLHFSTSVTEACASLSKRLTLMETALDSDHTNHTQSIFSFRDYHAKVLDRMRQSLFLRKRYEEVLKLIEDIFEHILRSAKMAQEETPSHDDTRELLISLTKKISIFVRVCRGLEANDGRSVEGKIGTASYSDSQDHGHGDTTSIGVLLLALDMNDFFND